MAEQIHQDQAMPEKAQVEHERSVLDWAVRVSAAIMCVLLLVFFIVVVRSVSTINSQVEYVKDAPYPISVAAGHVETELVHLRSFIERETPNDEMPETGIRGLEKSGFEEIIEELNTQIGIIKSASPENDVACERLNNLFDLLKLRADRYFDEEADKEASSVNYGDLYEYGKIYLVPVINTMLDVNDEIIEASSQWVEDMYTEVSGSSSVLISFTLIMSIASIIIFILLLVVIRIMGKFEKNLRENLTKALRETEEANQAKSSFMANMSHDIRTPMNAIFGLTQIAIENIDDTLRVKQCLTRITTSSQHLLSLINDVLDMNKIESGKVTLSKEMFSLTSLADEIEALFQSQTDTKKRQTEVVLDGIYADLLMGDAMRLRQILLNLVSNALKYTNEGDVTRLVIRERRTTDPQKASVTFIVEDTGIGMQKEFIDHIFEPFERENNDFTNFTEGTGLGMAITKSFVDLMGGTINVDSDLGIGTTVTINIDFEIAKTSDKDDHVLSGQLETKELVEGLDEENVSEDISVESKDGNESEVDEEDVKPKKPKKLSVSGNVLIVEDNDINMEIAKQLISSRGATVHEAYDGIEACKMVSCSEEGDYDLIFMDWQMPHMNGIEATKSIRKYLDERGRTQIPIVAMTANAFESDKKTAMEVGMNDFMAKPINIHQLEDVLKRYLHYNS